ncbi:outer membrane beta-barrel protein [Capnocytophaga sputigena]|uniref:outer membrane beta-barrel protein n=1 Tax=Capnocytophaga sputigena TaxID=1019 RepID=UPI0028D03931|nr:outer membrane beta-barrel protein [Capnocytophaga sputigena]
MRKTFLSVSAFVLLSVSAVAQVKDISFAVAPTADYVWFPKKTAVTNGFMAGGYVGFGFGRNLELLGSYKHSIGLKSTLDGYDAPAAISNVFEAKDVSIYRWGGELKGNIPMAYSFQPYVTLGSGVQTIKANDLSQNQVYFGLGIGSKFNLARRLTLNIEAKATHFSLDSRNILYKPTEANTSAYNSWINNNVEDKSHLAWSVGAGLELYLGGRNPNELTELDQVYTSLKGFKVVIEPTLGYLNFSDDSNLRDAYFGGLALGVDFTEYIGVRGYYHRAMKDEKFSAEFDKLSIYGGDFLARLNVAKGVVPYLQIGVGYMKVGDDYVGKVVSNTNTSGIFAKGGVGLAIPLGKRVELFGVANLMYTTRNEDVSSALSSVHKLQSNVFYNAGVRIKLAKSVEKELYEQELGAAEAEKVWVATPTTTTNVASTTSPVSPEKRNLAYYNSQITAAEKQLQMAYQNGDTANANRLLKEKQQWENLRNTYVAERLPYPASEQVRLVRMTPEELQQLINDVVKRIREGEVKSPEQRIDRLEKLLLEMQDSKGEIQEEKIEIPASK